MTLHLSFAPMRIAAAFLDRRIAAGRLACLGTLFAALIAPAFALEPTRDLLQYSCQTWTRQNGLPVNGVRSIAQSADGYLWLGTSLGLVRFDGTEFSLLDPVGVPGFRTSIVTTIAPSRSGGLWVGFENGSFGRFDGAKFKMWDLQRPRSAPALNMRNLSTSADGTVFLSAQREAARITPDGEYEPFMIFSDDFKFNLLFHFGDSQGRQWLGTAGNGLFYWRDGKLAKFAEFDGRHAVGVVEDLEHNLWIATPTEIYCFDPELRPRSEFTVGSTRTLLVDRHGVLWVGTDGHGLFRYQNGVLRNVRKLDGLASDYVISVYEDQEGSLWVGTRDGLSQLSDLKFPAQSVASDPATDYAAAVSPSPRGGVWVAGRSGLSYFGKTAAENRFVPGTASAGSAKRVYEARDGDVYFVTGTRTLGILAGDEVVALHPARNLVVGMAEDAEGMIVSVGGELFRASRQGLKPYAFKEGPPDFHWILNLANGRDGAIWVACERGLFRVKDGKYEQWSIAEGAREAAVQTVMEDPDGTVWASGFANLIRLKEGKLSVITRKAGLFDQNIYALAPDDFGNFWIDSGRGIFRVSRRDVNDFLDGKIPRVESEAFDGADCVKTTDKTYAQERSGCRSTDGRIWFPSAKGIVVIDPAHIPMNRNAPAVHLDRVIANGQPLNPREPAHFGPGKGELEFRFSALSFVAPQKARFRYQLVGYDRNWIEAGNRRIAFYTNLRPGRYTFNVIAANSDGVWNTTGDSMPLELKPHVYQTTWFYALCGSGVIAVFGGAYYARIRLLQQRQRALQAARDQLELEVANRTAELASANTSLHGEIENHRRTEAQLQQQTHSLEQEIEERKRMQNEIERVHRELVDISRQAGMAEVATSVLHNVGNVLNSVNVSATLLMERTRSSKVMFVSKVGSMLQAKAADLAGFFANDAKGRKLPEYLSTLGSELSNEQQTSIDELGHLRKNIEHIKEIVSMQQNFATSVGVAETLPLTEVVEDAIRINSSALSRHHVELVRDFQSNPVVTLERHKVLQVLVNLMRNAKQACDDAERADKRVIVQTTEDATHYRISVIDNGIGIPAENLTRIFSHGFTTKKEGHGFGLHSGALTAKELRGALLVHSDGPDQGATFTLEIGKEPVSAGA